MAVLRWSLLSHFRSCALLLAFASLCLARSAPPGGNAGGVGAEWNTRERHPKCQAHCRGEAYPGLPAPRNGLTKALRSTRSSWNPPVELRGIEWALNNLSGKPEKLSFALDAYFRVQSFRMKVSSMSEAVRNYQNPAVAELIDAYLTDSSASQIQLQGYLTELAGLKEAELDVMSQEAQRCRVQQIQRGNRPKLAAHAAAIGQSNILSDIRNADIYLLLRYS